MINVNNLRKVRQTQLYSIKQTSDFIYPKDISYTNSCFDIRVNNFKIPAGRRVCQRKVLFLRTANLFLTAFLQGVRGLCSDLVLELTVKNSRTKRANDARSSVTLRCFTSVLCSVLSSYSTVVITSSSHTFAPSSLLPQEARELGDTSSRMDKDLGTRSHQNNAKSSYC